jgi:hypothetical protein
MTSFVENPDCQRPKRYRGTRRRPSLLRRVWRAVTR